MEVEAAPYGPRRFPHLADHINQQSPGSSAEGLESKGLRFCADANRMGPYVFGSQMATQAAERSKSEATHTSSQNNTDKFRFGGFSATSSFSTSDAGGVNRTVPLSEYLAFRSRSGKSSGKQTPAVFKDSTPATSSSFSTFNICGGATVFNGSSNPAPSLFSNSFPKVVSSGSSLVADARESSASSQDSKYATSSFSTFPVGLKPNAASSYSGPFVFTAGAQHTRSVKLETQTNVPPDRLFSGSTRPASQSNIPTDSLFSGIPRPGAQSNVSSDSTLSGSLRPGLFSSVSKDISFSGPSQSTEQSNTTVDSFFSASARPSTQASSSTEPSLMGSSISNSQPKFVFGMPSTGLAKPTTQADIPFEELLAANSAAGVGGGLKAVSQINRFANIEQNVPVDIFRKLNHLDIDKGSGLLPKLEKLDLNKGGDKIVKPTAVVLESGINQKLKKLDIDKGEGLQKKLENLNVSKVGKNAPSKPSAFVFGSPSTSGPSTSTPEVRTPSGAPFVFGAATDTQARASNVPASKDNDSPQIPPAPNLTSAFKFSSEGEVKPPVSKLKKDKFQHRSLRPGQRSCFKGKRSSSTNSSARSEAASPSPSRESVSMDISPESTNETSTSSHSGYPTPNKSLVPEYDDGDSDEDSGGTADLNSMNELEASISKLRAAVSELKFGAESNRSKETSSSAPFPNVAANDSWSSGKITDDVSSSTSYGANWKRTPFTDTQSVDRTERDNGTAEQGETTGSANERDDIRGSGADRNEGGTETSSGQESSCCTDEGQPRTGSEGKGGHFTFTASPTGMSTSNLLRRRTRKVQRNVGRLSQAEKASIPALQPDRGTSRPSSTVKPGTWSSAAPITGLAGPAWGGSGLGGSGYGEGVNTSGGMGAAAAAEQVCERWRLRGNQAYAKGDFVKAEEFYSLGAGSVSPHETSQSCLRASVLCYSNRAATRMVVGRMREALADCMHAMAVDPSFIRVHLRAASCHLALGETELAASAFKECLKQAKQASKLDSKVLADASDGLKKAQQVAEYSCQARKLVLNNSSNDSVTALRLLNEALLCSPQSEWLLELKAYLLISLQRYTEAVQVCEQSLDLAEQNFAASEGVNNRLENSPLGWRRRITAKANFHLGKLEESLEQLQQLQEGPSSMFPPDPDSPGALSAGMALPSTAVIRDLLRHKLEGNKAFQAGKYTEALEHYTAALARNGESRPFCAVCLCNRAAASQALGHIADAIADCSRAIVLDPRYAKAISRRASLHEKVRDYGQSCSDLGRLIAIYERQQPQTPGLKSTKGDGSAGTTTSVVEELQLAKERLSKAEEEMKKGYPLDHYCILGLELGCSGSEIKKAYRKAALRHHPDKAGQFLMRSGDTGDDPSKDAMDETIRKEGERLIEEIRKDSEQLFKLIGEAYAVLSDPAKRARYDSEEELRKLRTRSSDLAKNVYSDRRHSRASDGVNVNKGWSSSSSGGDSGSQSRASRQRDRWEGFNYQRWHPGPDAAQPDVYARRGRPTGSSYGSSHRSTSWRWEEYPWDEV